MVISGFQAPRQARHRWRGSNPRQKPPQILGTDSLSTAPRRPNDDDDGNDDDWFLYIASPQQGDLRLSGRPSGLEPTAEGSQGGFTVHCDADASMMMMMMMMMMISLSIVFKINSLSSQLQFKLFLVVSCHSNYNSHCKYFLFKFYDFALLQCVHSLPKMLLYLSVDKSAASFSSLYSLQLDGPGREIN
ncbi:hypothetical protein PoB_006676500 [Plakobranchus ocellatus]|uniref:Uncharacterized protein n=1 Tax=Plakobranchus ocellatus TaxID=259542 RepID=A0AAV4D8F8_9GAST|nr:hypothetical protein PoB_006676500 [Plakobranchus ocellatus]